MIPGPVEIPNDILEAFDGQSPVHYGADYAAMYIDLSKKISKIFSTAEPSFLIPGSGSLGLETAAASICQGKKCLILENGWFGERLRSILSKYSSESFTVSFDKFMDLNLLEKEIIKIRPQIVALTHVETSTGVLNRIREVSQIARKVDAMVLVDAISSACLEELSIEPMGIDVVITASQKGFESPPGLAIVSLSGHADRALPKADEGHSWYTNLGVWKRFYEDWRDWHPFPVTLPTNIVSALRESVNVIDRQGLGNRLREVEETSEKFRRAMNMLGLINYVQEGYAHGITSVCIPESAELDIVSYLYERFDIRIAGSLGKMKGKIFRVSHMSRPQRERSNLIKLVRAISSWLEDSGISADSESAVETL